MTESYTMNELISTLVQSLSETKLDSETHPGAKTRPERQRITTGKISPGSLALIQSRHISEKPDTSGLKPFNISMSKQTTEIHPEHIFLSSIIYKNPCLPAGKSRAGNLLALGQLTVS